MNAQNIRPDCPCTANCARHGNCVACVEHHCQICTLVACMRPVAQKLYAENKED